MKKKVYVVTSNETQQCILLEIKNKSGRLSGDEIKRMIREAEKHRKEDETVRIAIAAKNKLQDYCYEIKNVLTDTQHGLLESDHAMILHKCNVAIDWVDSDQIFKKEEYERKHEYLEAEYRLWISNNSGNTIGGALFASK